MKCISKKKPTKEELLRITQRLEDKGYTVTDVKDYGIEYLDRNMNIGFWAFPTRRLTD